MADRNRQFPDVLNDDDGYDDAQRAEILEATRDGPSDGTILTDLAPDLGDEEEVDDDEAEEPLADLSIIDIDALARDA
ncbi:hypothetical protein ABTL01_20195, partial [Acinetobacter baumannii]